MLYLKLEDLNIFIKQNVIDDLSENDYNILNQLEEMSIAHVDGFIGYKYDTIAGMKQRNQFLIMLVINIFAYHFNTRMTHTSMEQIVEDRFNNAMDTLKDISFGKINPNLPMNEPAAGEYKAQNVYITDTKITSIY